MVVSFGYGGIPENVSFFGIQNASVAKNVRCGRDYISAKLYALIPICSIFTKNLVDYKCLDWIRLCPSVVARTRKLVVFFPGFVKRTRSRIAFFFQNECPLGTFITLLSHFETCRGCISCKALNGMHNFGTV